MWVVVTILVVAIFNSVVLVLTAHSVWNGVQTSRQTTKMIDAMLPSLKEIEGRRSIFNEILTELRSDEGHSLHDIANRIEEAIKAQLDAAELLKVGVREAKFLSEQDRNETANLLVELRRLVIKIEAGNATMTRIESAADSVAADLADAHRRADEVSEGAHGAAADAAARQTDEEKKLP